MPDRSMCPSTGCPSRAACIRNEASGTRANEWRQSWIEFDRRRSSAARCDAYWPAGPGRLDATLGGVGVGDGRDGGEYGTG